jgi:hypothetical protein
MPATRPAPISSSRPRTWVGPRRNQKLAEQEVKRAAEVLAPAHDHRPFTGVVVEVMLRPGLSFGATTIKDPDHEAGADRSL